MSRDPVIDELLRRVAALEGERVRYLDAEVTSVGDGSFAVAVPGELDGRELAGIPPASPHHVPDVGTTAKLAVVGAQVLHQPGEIAEGVIGRRELEGSVVSDLDVALSIGDGKNSATFSLNDPPAAPDPAPTPGDLWFKRDAQRRVVGFWTWDGAEWASTTINHEVVASVAAGAITTGTLAAGVSITVGDTAVEYTLIGGSGVSFFADDDVDGVPTEITRVGRTTGGVDPATGRLSWYIDQTGVANLAGLNVTGDARVGGVPLAGLLGDKANIEAWTFNWADPGATVDEIGMVELTFTAKAHHAYLLLAGGIVPDVDGGGDRHAVAVRVRATTDGTAPVKTSPVKAIGTIETRYDAFPWENSTIPVIGLHHQDSDTDSQIRTLLTIAKPPAATSVKLYTDFAGLGPRYYMVLDMGTAPGDSGQPNAGGGSLVVGQPPPAPPPAAPKVDGETIYNATWVSNFRGNGSYVDYDEAYQGYNPAYTPNGDMRSFLGFTEYDISVNLQGADLRYIRLWLRYGHWYRLDGGYPLIDLHGHQGQVFSPTGQFGKTVVGPWLGRGGGAWIDLPLDWAYGFKDGTYRGIALGPAGTTDGTFHGRANGPGQADAPKLAIGWTK